MEDVALHQRFPHAAQQLAFEEYVAAAGQAAQRIDRLTREIGALVPSWSLAPLVEALQAMRGFAFITAVTTVAEVADFSRFPSARALMAWAGLVPSEHSSGGSVRRGRITKTGNRGLR